MATIAVYGGSFNPPLASARAIAAAVAEVADEVVVVPSGPRPDSPTLADIAPLHRAVMCDLCFQDLPRVRVDLSDLERAAFTRTHGLQARFAAQGAVRHVVLAERLPAIPSLWERGPELLRTLDFIVVHRPGHPPPPEQLPARSQLLPVDYQDGSAAIRAAAVNHQPIDEALVPAAVARYIRRHGLYRGPGARRETRLALESRRFLVHCDPFNPRAAELAARLPVEPGDPEAIVVYGGDGTMLRAIREHWRRRLPFIGLNTGHVGFLLNDPPDARFWEQPLDAHQLPMLQVEATRVDGRRHSGLAFNDAWVERVSGQSAWMRISVNGEVRIPKAVGDGFLVATAAGSTSYARAMGAPPLPFHMPLLVLAGSNLLLPEGWRSVVAPLADQVTIEALDPDKRPLVGYIDGEPTGQLAAMRIQLSGIAAAEVAFLPGRDPAAKLHRIQFPRG